jgi:diaminohydroxyphosphoribosylaminopyrimidine deaminase/5-amino-6-(5-phosphoribosylamino)uracil reductase
MRRALALARRGQGLVEPNPMVGAVVVRDGRVVGEGYHRRYGGPHAEVEALRAAGRRAKGATVYVTLEPCCHWGKTPPCTDAILAADVKRVVAAMIDPFPKVHGKGRRILRGQGVQVDIGLLQEEARQLNGPFLTRLGKGRPYVIGKWAQSLDGALATAAGESKWISGETSRKFVHSLRSRVDGILIGIGTALADDPLLTVRGPVARRIATRIVVDSECRLPVGSRLVKTIPEAPVLVAHRRGLSGAAERRRRALAERGVMMAELPADRAGRVRMKALLQYLGEQEYTNVMVEGGAVVLSSLLRQGLVDEAHVYIAPMVVGGSNARRIGATDGGTDLVKLADAVRLNLRAVERSGDDVHVMLEA